jgi:hypothetical protein
MKRFTPIIGVLCALLLAGSLAGSSSLRSDMLALIPATVGEVAYIDLQEVRRSPHYATIKQRVVPERFGEFERFIRVLGVDVDTDLDWLAWGLVSTGEDVTDELFFGIVQGRFDEDRVQGYFTTHELPTAEHQGTTLYLHGEADSPHSFAFALFDRSTGAFGTRQSLEYLLDTRNNLHPNLNQNADFSRKIGEVNGRTPIWVVMDSQYTRLAMSQLLPELAKFEEFATVADRFSASKMRMSLMRDASINLEVQCEQAADAQTLSFLLQTGLTAQGWQSEEEAPELNAVLSRADVRSVGSTLRVALVARESELRTLLTKPIKLFP